MTNVLSGAIAAGGPLGIIASMITPAFLILSAANLIGSTLVRLGRTVDRARVVIALLDSSRKAGDAKALAAQQAALRQYGKRGALIQAALATFYVAIGCFVASSLAIALANVAGHADSWIPAWLTVAGVVPLFIGTVLLFGETRIATRMLHREIASALEGA